MYLILSRAWIYVGYILGARIPRYYSNLILGYKIVGY